MVCWHKRKCNHRVRKYRESRERCHQRCNDVLRTHSLLPGSILLLAIFIFSIRHQAHFNRQQRLPTRLILVIIPGWALLVSCSAHISLHRHTTPPLHRSISRSGRKPQRGLATLSTWGDQKNSLPSFVTSTTISHQVTQSREFDLAKFGPHHLHVELFTVTLRPCAICI